MFIVGLTGGLATGKSTVLAIFKARGIAVIDADEISREVIEPDTSGWREIRAMFGDRVLLPDRRVNRAKISKLIFHDIEKRQKLNEITHPRIQRAMIRIAMSYFFTGYQYVVMEVPLLFETGRMLSFMHKIITVVCDDHQQIERLCERNNYSVEGAVGRIKTQLPLEFKVERSDFVIDNSVDYETTRRQTEEVIEILQKSKFSWYCRGVLLVVMLSILIAFIQVLPFNIVE